jgi:hypothetical protein
VNRPRAWIQGTLLLTAYVVVSSVLGLILLIVWWVGPVGVLVVWSTSIAADVVFVIGSITAAVVGVAVTTSKRGSILRAAAITWLTYGIAAEIALSAFGTLVNGGSTMPDNFPSLPIVLFDAPLLGLAGMAFAAIAPALLRERVKRLLSVNSKPST